MNRYFSLPLTLCACLFIGCGGIDDNQPAQLISTVPAEDEYINSHDLIHLYFDKAVTDVRVNGFAAENRQLKLSAAAWEINASKLDIWPRGIGTHPEALVQLNITFEDDVGRHDKKLNVRRPALIAIGNPLVMTGGNVHDGAKNIDPELHNTHGIQFTFNDNIQAGTVILRSEDGEPLNWIAEWGRNVVTLYAPDGNRLQNGTEYILEIIGVKDERGNEYNFEIRFTTKE